VVIALGIEDKMLGCRTLQCVEHTKMAPVIQRVKMKLKQEMLENCKRIFKFCTLLLPLKMSIQRTGSIRDVKAL
jgi:hypothetical protein